MHIHTVVTLIKAAREISSLFCGERTSGFLFALYRNWLCGTRFCLRNCKRDKLG